mmetsp:Transcript_19935/g.29561  ORF Transcript_19935/g.29561 Transcript_19935/m.29561 type:complete len:316 (-) Transcript_19935:477-1424(-)
MPLVASFTFVAASVSNSDWHRSSKIFLNFFPFLVPSSIPSIGVFDIFRQSPAYMDAKCGSSCALFTIIPTAPVRQSISRPIPQLIKSSDNLSNLVRDNLLRINNARRRISSLLSTASSSSVSPSFPTKTLAFHRVSSLTSRGLQSSSAGAVSFGFSFLRRRSCLDTSPPMRSALAISTMSASRVGVFQWHASGGSQDEGAARFSKRIDRISKTLMRFTAFSTSELPSPGFKSSVGTTFPLDHDLSSLPPSSPPLLPRDCCLRLPPSLLFVAPGLAAALAHEPEFEPPLDGFDFSPRFQSPPLLLADDRPLLPLCC